MRVTSKMRINRRDWSPDPRFSLHRIDIFLVNGVKQCSCCGQDTKETTQETVIPSQNGEPWGMDECQLSEEDREWCRAENKALLELFPAGSEFWTKGI